MRSGVIFTERTGGEKRSPKAVIEIPSVPDRESTTRDRLTPNTQDIAETANDKYQPWGGGQVSLEPLKPFRAIVEVFVKRKTGGGRWRYEVKVEATDAPPDDHISLRASVGGVSSAVFRLCNRYLGYAPFQVNTARKETGMECGVKARKKIRPVRVYVPSNTNVFGWFVLF